MNYELFLIICKQAEKHRIENHIPNDLYVKTLEYQKNNKLHLLKNNFERLITELIHSGDEFISILEIRNNLYRQSLWIEDPNNKIHYYFKVFNTIFYLINQQKLFSTNKKHWLQLIVITTFYLNNFKKDNLSIELPSIQKSVEACRFFKNKGIDISIKKGKIKLHNQYLIYNLLERLAHELGNELFVHLMEEIKRFKNSESGLFEFRISTPIVYQGKVQLLPYGLMLNVAFKFINTPCNLNTYSDVLDKLKQFKELSAKYTALFELQTYGFDIQTMMTKHINDLLPKLSQFIMIDNFFKVEQYVSGDVYDFVQFIAKEYLEHTKNKIFIQKFIN